MIIPMRCMNCGNPIADKWRYWQKMLREMKGEQDKERRLYFDGSAITETPEKKILDSLGLKRPCCRKHFLTHVDLIDKV